MTSKDRTTEALTLQQICKSFPGVKALDDISMGFCAGTVHAICGENGAGKSTLMKILSGNYRPDSGHVLLDGMPVVIRDQRHAQDLGISIVYQERSLANHLTVAENIYVCNQPKTGLGFQRTALLRENTTALLMRLNLQLPTDELVGNLSPGMQQMVEIAKALSQQPKILILDEPTASITEAETRSLFALIGLLKANGVAILYISHRMAEIFEIADVVSVLKDGRLNGTFPIAEVTEDGLVRCMVGRSLPERVYKPCEAGSTVLEVSGLSGKRFSDISFALRRGEIVGLAGLVGAGRTELAYAIFGVERVMAGEIFIDGALTRMAHPADAMRNGIAYVSEERKERGLFLGMSIRENLISTNPRQVARNGFVRRSLASETADRMIAKLRVKTVGSDQEIGELSGGNQQKVILAKWLLTNPKVLIVDEPTHGVDVGAKAEIHALLKTIANKGCAILLISSELPELLGMSDRVLVMREGRVVHEIDGSKASEEHILAYAAGTGDRGREECF